MAKLTDTELKKQAFDNLKEHLNWMVREKMLQQFSIRDEDGLPHILITAVPQKCTDCGKDKNISTEQL